MFMRVSTYRHEGRQDEIEKWISAKTDDVRAIEGLVTVDTFESAPGEGVIVASYTDEGAFLAASGTVKAILGELGQFLSSPPQTVAGNTFWTTRN